MKRMMTAALLVCGLWSMVSGLAWATALSAARDTPFRAREYFTFTQGSNVIYAGAMVAVSSGAVAIPASDTSAAKVIGRAEKTQDNTGVNYLATRTIKIMAGTFRWANGGSYTVANVGDLTFVADDQTVWTAASATYDVVAGVIVDVDATGVWVDTHDIGSQGAASLTTLHATGAATLDSTLAVTGKGTFGAALTSGATTNTSLAVTGVADVTGALTSGPATNSTLAVTGAARVGTTLNVIGAAVFTSTISATGAVTLVAMPVLTATNVPGAVVGSPLDNLPTSATTNAIWIKVGVGAASYVVPGYKLP